VSSLRWRWLAFDALTTRQLHDLLALRQRVFVVEQKCAYQDVDGADLECVHGLGERDGVLVATARLVPPGLKFEEPAIGRVATALEARGSGFGRELMREAIRETRARWPGRPIRIGAQRYLERFYGELGFVVAGEPYDEDGIPHVEMLLR
jgi:ElaA protein